MSARIGRIILRVTLIGSLGIACGATATGLAPHADLTVLFIGNSLTATNDLPSLTRSVAAAHGRSLGAAVSVVANASLEDHANAGAAELIAARAADVVVLQQGPSALPASQEHLRYWTEQLAGPIRVAGGTPALLMVWPDAGRIAALDDVHDAYRDAAAAVDGIFIPAGDAWLAVWRRDPDAALYSGDGFHPSHLGSLVAALTIYAVLFDADVRALPRSLAPDMTAVQWEMILAAVHEAVQNVAAR